MTAALGYDDIDIGTTLPEREFTILLADLIRYCGAASDFVGVHWNRRTAVSVGLSDVIAHGSLTVAHTLRILTDWAGPGAVEEYRTRYSSPLPVPDDDAGVRVTATGTVLDKLGDNRVVVGFEVRSGGQDVLSGLRAVVRLPATGRGA